MQQKKWQGKKNLCCALKYFWLTHNQIVIFSIILMFSLGWMRLGFHHLFWVLLVHKWILRVKFSFWVSWLMNDVSTSVSQQVHLETAHAFVLCFLEGKKKVNKCWQDRWTHYLDERSFNWMCITSTWESWRKTQNPFTSQSCIVLSWFCSILRWKTKGLHNEM